MSETNDASIVILSADLSAKQLIDAVGIEPDKKWNRNDPITEAGKGRYPKSGLRYNSLLDPSVRLPTICTRWHSAWSPLADHC